MNGGAGELVEELLPGDLRGRRTRAVGDHDDVGIVLEQELHRERGGVAVVLHLLRLGPGEPGLGDQRGRG
jgi:hypothetical protein